jgi:hypothetical protein
MRLSNTYLTQPFVASLGELHWTFDKPHYTANERDLFIYWGLLAMESVADCPYKDG